MQTKRKFSLQRNAVAKELSSWSVRTFFGFTVSFT